MWTSEALNVSGTDYKSFKETVTDLANHTHTKHVTMNSTKFIFPCLHGGNGFTADGCVRVKVMDHEALKGEIYGEESKPLKIKRDAIPEDLLMEWYGQALPMIQPNGEGLSFFTSRVAIPTFCQTAKVGGEDTVSCGNEYRNKHLAYQFTAKAYDCTIVYREEERAGFAKPFRKIVSVNSARYGYVPQTVLCEIIEKIIADGVVGKFDVVKWSIDQEFTKILIVFPEIAEDFDATYKLPSKLVPGLLLQTSDAAQSSLTVRGVLCDSTYSHVYPVIEKSAKHTSGNASGVGKFVAECEKDIFPEFRKLPEALVSAMGVELGDPSADLTDPGKAQKNHDMVMERVRTLAKSMISPKNHVSKKLVNELCEALSSEINGEIRYTLYDIDLLFLQLPERVNVCKRVKDDLTAACAKIPYIAGKTIPEEERVFLIPA